MQRQAENDAQDGQTEVQPRPNPVAHVVVPCTGLAAVDARERRAQDQDDEGDDDSQAADGRGRRARRVCVAGGSAIGAARGRETYPADLACCHEQDSERPATPGTAQGPSRKRARVDVCLSALGSPSGPGRFKVPALVILTHHVLLLRRRQARARRRSWRSRCSRSLGRCARPQSMAQTQPCVCVCVCVRREWFLIARMAIRSPDDGEDIAEPFMNKPSRKLYPDYYKIIAHPISLNDMRVRQRQPRRRECSTHHNACVYPCRKRLSGRHTAAWTTLRRTWS
jgi:hypothetical protein